MIDRIAPWPSDHLETVPNCPVCGNAERTLVHEDLTDVTFFTAKGAWNLWQCGGCGSGYIDPRPDEASIIDAYGAYYTHNTLGNLDVKSTGNFRHRLGNGYRNWRFGTRMEPSSPLGPLAAGLFPRLRKMYESSYRFLPKPSGRNTPRILDFGCGSGTFLRLAHETGLEAFGVEPDPVARGLAACLGIDVRASLDDFEGFQFDAVTISHVIEHVHRPIELLRQIRDHLPTGGHLFLETPNMDAIGHQIYGRHWRGLEAPRHIILFTQASLRQTLIEAGFGGLRYREQPDALEFTQSQSRKIAAGQDPYGSLSAGVAAVPSASDFLKARVGPAAEFLCVTATRA